MKTTRVGDSSLGGDAHYIVLGFSANGDHYPLWVVPQAMEGRGGDSRQETPVEESSRKATVERVAKYQTD